MGPGRGLEVGSKKKIHPCNSDLNRKSEFFATFVRKNDFFAKKLKIKFQMKRSMMLLTAFAFLMKNDERPFAFFSSSISIPKAMFLPGNNPIKISS